MKKVWIEELKRRSSLHKSGKPEVRSKGSAIRLLCIVLAAALSGCLSGQDASNQSTGTAAAAPTLLVRPMPERFEAHLARFGKRLTVAGKECISVQGTLSRGTVSKDITLVWQLPGTFILKVGNGTGESISFVDGVLKSSLGPLSKEARQFLDALVLDWPESVFASVDKGAGLRLLGLAFQPAPGDDSTPVLDLYELHPESSPTNSLGSIYEHPRIIGFDSEAGVLAVVRHVNDSGDVVGETRFLHWTTTAGETFPDKISYREEGKELVQFTITNFVVQPVQNAGIFQQ